MRERFGDGSVTAAVLARGIAREMHRLIAGGGDAVLLQRGLEKGVQAAVAALEAMSIPLTRTSPLPSAFTAIVPLLLIVPVRPLLTSNPSARTEEDPEAETVTVPEFNRFPSIPPATCNAEADARSVAPLALTDTVPEFE